MIGQIYSAIGSIGKLSHQTESANNTHRGQSEMAPWDGYHILFRPPCAPARRFHTMMIQDVRRRRGGPKITNKGIFSKI